MEKRPRYCSVPSKSFKHQRIFIYLDFRPSPIPVQLGRNLIAPTEGIPYWGILYIAILGPNRPFYRVSQVDPFGPYAPTTLILYSRNMGFKVLDFRRLVFCIYRLQIKDLSVYTVRNSSGIQQLLQ